MLNKIILHKLIKIHIYLTIENKLTIFNKNSKSKLNSWIKNEY